MFVHVAV